MQCVGRVSGGGRAGVCVADGAESDPPVSVTKLQDALVKADRLRNRPTKII